MKNIKHAFILTFVFFSINITAQKKEDVLYLKNGSIIRGMVKSDTTNHKVKILNHSGDVLVFNAIELDSVTRENVFHYKAFIFLRNNFEYKINAAFLARTGEHSIGKDVIPGFDFTCGYRYRNISAATGAGVQFYDQTQIPVFGEVRMRFSERFLSPFLFIRSGYAFPAEKRSNDWSYSYKSLGGFNFTSGLGIESITSENTSILVSISYHYQALNYNLTPLWTGGVERKRIEKFNRFSFSFGFLFK